MQRAAALVGPEAQFGQRHLAQQRQRLFGGQARIAVSHGAQQAAIEGREVGTGLRHSGECRRVPRPSRSAYTRSRSHAGLWKRHRNSSPRTTNSRLSAHQMPASP